MTIRPKLDVVHAKSCTTVGGNCPFATLTAVVRDNAINNANTGDIKDSDVCRNGCLQQQDGQGSEWDVVSPGAPGEVRQCHRPHDAGLLLQAGRWAAYDYSTKLSLASGQLSAFRSDGLGVHSEGRASVTSRDQLPPMPYLSKEVRTVLFADVVDSVRMMQRAEEQVVRRWVEVFGTVCRDIGPRHAGRFIKGQGDGFVFDFTSTVRAIECALAIQAFLRRFNEGLAAGEQIELRIGIDVGEIFIGDLDVYGHRVNVAARLMSGLAAPGQIVLSSEARDLLTHGLDADFEDLGERLLKGIDAPVRAYLAWPPGYRPAVRARPSLGRLLPSIAVIPFVARLSAPQHAVLGDILAEDTIRILSRSLNLDVISRLSTMAFRDRPDSVAEITKHLKASFILSGSYVTDGSDIRITVELCDVRHQRVIWSDQFRDKVPNLLVEDGDLINRIVRGAYEAIAASELSSVRLNNLGSVESYSLLLSAIILMHRRSATDFMLARRMLETIIEREPRHPLPKAWLANWYVLRIQQGMSTDVLRDRNEAVHCTSSALDVDPDSSLALAIAGLVHTHMTKRHDLAEESYRIATEKNPNDALAWLLKGTHHAFTGDGDLAVHDTQRALKLSPMDPQSYYFYSLSATALLSNDDCEGALQHADTALLSNKLHSSTLRVKAVSQWRLGLHTGARETGKELLRLEPQFTVSSWLNRSPASSYEFGREAGRTLRDLGMPE